MAYAKTYDSTDISYATIDLIVGIIAGLFAFVSLIVLVLLYGWFKKHSPVKL